ncbi:MAG: pilus assembly PilX N-terminal domain-containing protein [Bdellovibrionota bacterium]
MNQSKGFALISVLMFMAVVLALVGTYSLLSHTEVQSLHASKDSFNGFNAAEAGLNIRAEMIKDQFINYNRPSGTSPVNEKACALSGTKGSGDFVCKEFDFSSHHSASTYVVEHPGNPTQIVIPPGEPFAGLTASEYRYTVTSLGRRESQPVGDQAKEADLELMFKTRLVPLFQFLLFFDDDMELVEGGEIRLNGAIHSNKDIYFAQQAAYWIPDPYSYFKGPVSSVGSMFRGAKFQSSCFGGSGGWSGGWNYDIFIDDLAAYRKLPTCAGNRTTLSETDLAKYNGNVQDKVPPLTVPDVNTFKAFATADPSKPNTFTYWSRADVRFVLRLNASGYPNTSNAATGIEVTDGAGNNMSAATVKLNDASLCPGLQVTAGGAGRAVGAKGDWGSNPTYASDSRLRLFREYQHYPAVNNFQTVLDVDVRALLTCMHKYSSAFFASGDIDDTTDDGLVLYFAIDGPKSSAAQNNYTVRFRNGAVLQATGTAPKVKGLTVVTDQNAVVWGDYNGSDATWIPAAVMSDALYILSNTWTDAKSNTAQDWWNRFTGTTVLRQNFAVLSGAMPSCGGNGVTCEGSFNDFGGGYTGLFRYNETFYDGNSSTTTYTQQPMYWKGSLVSLDAPHHDNTLEGPFNYFSSPSYEYAYDTRFNDPAKLPPLTPRAVYNRQELFERDYE